MPILLQDVLLEVGKQPLPAIATIDVHVFGWVRFPSRCVRMSRPGLQATRSGYRGHLMGGSAAGHPIGKTPI
jgi:hypothetical protein